MRLSRYLLEDWSLKLKMLWLYLPCVRDWWRDVALRESGESMCCSGRECGCMGADYYSYWEWLWETREARS